MKLPGCTKSVHNRFESLHTRIGNRTGQTENLFTSYPFKKFPPAPFMHYNGGEEIRAKLKNRKAWEDGERFERAQE
jgi:hypothetical protein